MNLKTAIARAIEKELVGSDPDEGDFGAAFAEAYGGVFVAEAAYRSEIIEAEFKEDDAEFSLGEFVEDDGDAEVLVTGSVEIKVECVASKDDLEELIDDPDYEVSRSDGDDVYATAVFDEEISFKVSCDLFTSDVKYIEVVLDDAS